MSNYNSSRVVSPVLSTDTINTIRRMKYLQRNTELAPKNTMYTIPINNITAGVSMLIK